ncbi:putative Ig domain-containing protein [Massilia glaciei]|uniref:Dystroglycan-type cadherin-like domain-containing protein n=1 Tax=Massilia glaciei TaxID=1524097 RepID=A0A2U2HGG1_9BURK|nr:putative Ig domain-containing protein [Massilia glaciei]PWF44027.1 hypothetical protein C7C56_019760 [Massilia glaciei]
MGVLAANLGTVTGFDGNAGATVAAPLITSVPVSAATAGQAYRYAATANDPQGLPLTWSLVDAPTGMGVNSAGVVAWDRPVSGMFTVTLRADNGRAYGEQRYVVSVGADVLPLEISLGIAPAIVNLGETVAITLLTNGGGGGGGAVVALTVDGQPVTLDAEGRAVVTGATVGAHQIVARATDSRGTIEKSSFYSVRVDGDVSAPLAKILSPADDVEVTAPVDITGTAFDASLAYYQLLLRPAGDGVWREIGRGTSPVTAGALGKLDPTQLSNGIYELALNVVDANGAKTTSLVTVDINREPTMATTA